MECKHCGGRVEWRGWRLQNFTHTECMVCGGRNCQLPENGELGVEDPLDRDDPTLFEYKRKLAIRDSALIDVREFVSNLKLGVTVEKRAAVLALLDKAIDA